MLCNVASFAEVPLCSTSPLAVSIIRLCCSAEAALRKKCVAVRRWCPAGRVKGKSLWCVLCTGCRETVWPMWEPSPTPQTLCTDHCGQSQTTARRIGVNLNLSFCSETFTHIHVYMCMLTVFFNCLKTIDTCLDQSNTTLSFCYYTLNTCYHTFNKSAALHFSCNCATHLLLSATHLLLHTISYVSHLVQKFKIQKTLGNLKCLDTPRKVNTYPTEHPSVSYKGQRAGA